VSANSNMDSQELITTKRRPLCFDEALEVVGGRGRWQVLLLALLWPARTACGLSLMAWNFVAYRPLGRCRVPECDGENAEYDDLASVGVDGCVSLRPARGGDSFADCADYLSSVANATNVVRKECQPEDMIFKDSIMRSTLTEDMGLFCEDQQSLLSAIGSSYMVREHLFVNK